MRKFLAISVGLLTMLAALAACGGGGSSKSSNSKSSGKDDEFNTLYGKAKDATVRVTYNTLDDAGNVSDTWTVSQRGANQVAYITKDSKIVVDGDNVTSCSNLDTEPTCEPVPGGPEVAKSMIAGYAGLFGAAATGIASAAAAGNFGDKSTETIAGQTVNCVTVTIGAGLGNVGNAIANGLGADTNAGYKACIDKDSGFLLSWTVVGVKDNKSGLVQTEVGEPKDEDFSAPTTSSTSEGETSTTTESGGSTTSIGGGATPTTGCVPLPPGVTLPTGITVPCVPAPGGPAVPG